MPETLRYLRDNPASPYRSTYDHVLIDEYQDLNRAEQTLLDLLASHGRVVVVGDEDQSIYSFKHAHPEGIGTFHDTHPDTHDEPLEECRRCPTLVVAMANALISNNDRQARALVPRPGNPDGDVRIVQWVSMDAEAAGIAQAVKARIDAAQVAPGEVLVLAPRRQFGYAARDALNNIGVPAYSFFNEEALDGNPKRLDESRAQQAFTLLTLLADRQDRVALRAWCGFGSNSLSAGAWRRLRAHCEQTGETPWDALEALALGKSQMAHTNPIIERFRAIQPQLAALEELVGQPLVDALFPEDADWAAPLRLMAADIPGEEYGPANLHDALRAAIAQPELPTDVDYVRVMSLHKSKGLTAKLVVVQGCIEGLIPFIDDELTPAEQVKSMQEQRRLFYVAITRTKLTLALSSVTRLPRAVAFKMKARVQGGNRDFANTVASRFIAELGPQAAQPIAGPRWLQEAVQ